MILAYWRWIALAVLLAASAAFGGATVYRHMDAKLRALQSDFDAFRGGVDALGKAAQIRAKEIELANLKRKQDADAQNAKARSDLDGLYAAYRSLRDSRTRSSLLPASTPGAVDPDRICFSRTALDRGMEAADGVLQVGAIPILQRGDKAIADLNTAKGWAQGR